MIKKFQNFVQKNVHYFLTIILLLVFFNAVRISTTKNYTEDIRIEVNNVDSLQKIIISKIENTSGDNLFALVNNLMKNNTKLDSLILKIDKSTINDARVLTQIKQLKNQQSRVKASINKIDKKLNELQINNDE